MAQDTIIVAANSQRAEVVSGKHFAVISATSKFTVEINGRRREVLPGAKISEPFKRIVFIETQGISNTIVFEAGDEEIGYVPADNSVSNAKTYAYGNLGIADGAGASGGNPACDANGNLIITNGMALLIPGTRNGNRRQMITFAVSKNSPASFAVQDANGKTFKVMDAGDDFAYPTDSDFIVSGSGGTAWVSIGQIFLNANA